MARGPKHHRPGSAGHRPAYTTLSWLGKTTLKETGGLGRHVGVEVEETRFSATNANLFPGVSYVVAKLSPCFCLINLQACESCIVLTVEEL